MKKVLTMLTALLLFSFVAALAAGGTVSDPIATKSYVDRVFAELNETAVAAAQKVSRTPAQSSALLERLDGLSVSTTAARVAAQIEYEGYMRLLDAGYYLVADRPTTVALKPGERLMVTVGSEFTLVSGSAGIDGARGAVVVNTTAGAEVYAGLAATKSARYVSAGGGIVGLQAVGEATVSVRGGYQIVPVMQTRHTDAALALQSLGLFRGTGSGFRLERGATRLEALIMFLRLIGEEQAALAHGGTHPFGDVPNWGGGDPDKYVAYAYSKGYTNGMSAKRFGANDLVSAEQYMTFILRALGYKDGTDFQWQTSLSSAVDIGIITSAERFGVQRGGFYRDNMAFFSYLALSARAASGDTTLLERLIAAAAVTRSAAAGLSENFTVMR